ncbi:hypothetical protein MPL1032_250037 [Mesorhizobium plurifarium]|uniref:Uncharacterized protein n=1 Tax=Mesorhizobium plurifarium TaxID=69974 RepID=A0A0K2W157_MESPL|nr:hypothetical protein MPL1032_250037 [Mesorhizobium plurifarium]
MRPHCADGNTQMLNYINKSVSYNNVTKAVSWHD